MAAAAPTPQHMIATAEAPAGEPNAAALERLELIEAAKRQAAEKAVRDYFDPSFRWVGIGSGTTIRYVVEAIKARMDPKNRAATLFVPTGYQSRTEIEKLDLISFPFDSLPEDQMLDVAFDGADEVDEDFNCIKGGGACLFQEKLVATRAHKFVCIADFRKDVPRLLTKWPYIPVEVAPISVKAVTRALQLLGCPNPTLRTSSLEKSGPIKTDQDFYLMKAPFPPLLTAADVGAEADPAAAAAKASGATWGKTAEGLDGRVWEAETLAAAIKSITGVLEVGLFVGVTGTQAAQIDVSGGLDAKAVMKSQGGQKPVAVYFGKEDGSVKVKKAHGEP